MSSRIGFCALCLALFALPFGVHLSAQEESGQWVLSEQENSPDALETDLPEAERLPAQALESEVKVPATNDSDIDQPLPPPNLEITDDLIDDEPLVADANINRSDSELTEQEKINSADAEEVDDLSATKAKKSTTISNVQLRRDLDETYASLSKVLQEEDSFSPSLGEHYYAYGSLLLQAGQFDDAREAFVDALHIAKINNGIYSLEQRPALRALFETHYAKGEAEESENFLRRIMWIETKVGGVTDDFTYDLLVKMGNGFIDQFLRRPVAGEVGIALLQKANLFLNYAVDRHGSVTLSERLLPFGELALVNMLQNSLMHKLKQSVSIDPMQSRSRREEERKARKQFEYLSQSFSRGELHLRRYLQKAQSEGNSSETIMAFLNLGDLSLMFDRKQAAFQYYQLAWTEAQSLPADDEIHQSFKHPLELPAFNYALPRSYVPNTRPTKLVPLTFTLRKNGRVGEVIPISKDDENYHLYSKVKRAVRKLVFRPPIVDGQVMPSRLEGHGVRVKVSAQPRASKKSRTSG